MKLDNVTQVVNVTGLVYPRNSSYFLSNIYLWSSVLPKDL